MAVPEDLLYTEENEWILVDGDEGTVGITDHAQDALGDVVFIELPETGEEYNQGDDFAVVESVKAVSDIFMPVSGRIIAVNEKLLAEPELINDSPLAEGWIVKIEIEDQSELDHLLTYQEYSGTEGEET
jgi:glycine cleavage system H protein